MKTENQENLLRQISMDMEFKNTIILDYLYLLWTSLRLKDFNCVATQLFLKYPDMENNMESFTIFTIKEINSIQDSTGIYISLNHKNLTTEKVKNLLK